MISGGDDYDAFAVWKMLFNKLGCVLQIFHGIKRVCFHSYGGGRYAAFFGGDEHGFIFCHITKGSLLHLSSAEYEMWGFSLVKKLCRKGNTIVAGFAAAKDYDNVGSFAFIVKTLEKKLVYYFGGDVFFC